MCPRHKASKWPSLDLSPDVSEPSAPSLIPSPAMWLAGPQTWFCPLNEITHQVLPLHPWRMKEGELGPIGHIFCKIVIRGLSSFSAAKTYLSLAEREKSTFYSSKRLLLLDIKRINLLRQLIFILQLSPATTTSNDPVGLQSR